jgi:processive 1,2-diacylglycerol beta-glucosyltransferase
MRVLITYITAGAGHRRIAEAIYGYLKDNRKDLTLKLVDLLPSASPFFRFCYNWGYPFLVHYATWLWGFFFWITESKLTRWFSRRCSRITNYFSCRKFIQYIKENDFDYIVSTHFLNSELISGLKSHNRINSKLITVITDFGVHPFWLSQGTDLYVVGSKVTKDKLLTMGVEESKVKDSGIPFSLNFVKNQNRIELTAKLGIKADMFTVLLMTGSFGLGPLEKIAASICADVQVLVVCANNKTLFNRLQKKNLSNVKVFGFIKNADELMAVSDIIITKPGGSSIVELINMELFPIFISAIPGQERENIYTLSACNVGYAPKNIKQIKDLVIDLKNNPQKLRDLKNNIVAVAKPFACRELANVIR